MDARHAALSVLVLVGLLALLQSVGFGLTLFRPWAYIPVTISSSSTPSTTASSLPHTSTVPATPTTTAAGQTFSHSSQGQTRIAVFALDACLAEFPPAEIPRPLFEEGQRCITYNTMQRIAEANSASNGLVSAVRRTRTLGVHMAVHFGFSLFILCAAGIALGCLCCSAEEESTLYTWAVMTAGLLSIVMVGEGIFAAVTLQQWDRWVPPQGRIGTALFLHATDRGDHIRDLGNLGVYVAVIPLIISVIGCCYVCAQQAPDEPKPRCPQKYILVPMD